MAELKNKPVDGAKATYDRLVQARDKYTQRAEKCALYTIPRLFPKEDDTGDTDYATPYNSVGARGVNNLASKLLLALLPPSQPFFRFGLTDEDAAKLQGDNVDSQLKDSVEYDLSMVEQMTMKYMESISIRATLFEAVKQLVVSGNALLFVPPKEDGIKGYSLRDYVVERDGIGNILQIVARDTVTKASLPQAIQDVLSAKSDSGDQDPYREVVHIYTHVFREIPEGKGEAKNFMSYQEVEGELVQGTEQTYPIEKTPWIPMRFSKVDGESYGRSFIEDYLGDLISLENLTKSIVDMSMIAAKVVFLVNPGSQTNIKALSKAENGAYVLGRQEDVVPVQLQKAQDMGTVVTESTNIEARLSYAFLLNSAVQRSGERVTAEEIRYVANELENTFGGTYSLLGEEVQLRLVKCIYNKLQRRGTFKAIEESGVAIEPTVITGVDALGRGQDASNLSQVIGLMTQLGEQAMGQINMNNFMMRMFTAYHIDATGLVKTPEEAYAEQEQAMDQYAKQTGIEASAQAATQQMAKEQPIG